MANIPLVVGFGGINPAGRSSGHHGYKRCVIDSLNQKEADATWQALSVIMNTDSTNVGYMAEHTLIRKIESQYFDVNAVPCNRKLAINPNGTPLVMTLKANQLPAALPVGWQVSSLPDGRAELTINTASDILVPDFRQSPVSAAGQLPTGFDPAALYQSRSHPRGLQLSVFAASDALGQMGIDWQVITSKVPADKISVYAGSAMSQMDSNGNGGLLGNNHRGGRITSKHLALGLAEMPADFVNAYVLGSAGTTGLNMGACATFHYNLRQGVHDIQAGRAQVVVVGASEAPLVPDAMEGYITMGALGTDEALRQLDGVEQADLRRACRPFGDNVGFTLAEGAQFVVLMDDDTALELGAAVYGAVPDVYVSADGHKKSISAPGIGNYITVAKAAGLAKQLVGNLNGRSFIHAHGTGTPQNRVSESHIFNETAKAFGIENWPVAAIKSYLGHTVAAAGGDQLISALGTWQHGIIPGITSIDGVADDVYDSNLQISSKHKAVDKENTAVALLNAKGFGGNNATACVLSPSVAEAMLRNKHGAKVIKSWQQKQEATLAAAQQYDDKASTQALSAIYQFDHNVRTAEHVSMASDKVVVAGYKQPIDLTVDSPLRQYCQE